VSKEAQKHICGVCLKDSRLHFVAVCCCVLQCTAVRCYVYGILQYLAVCCSVLQCGVSLKFSRGGFSDLLQRVAVCCSVLQRVAVCCIVLQ